MQLRRTFAPVILTFTHSTETPLRHPRLRVVSDAAQLAWATPFPHKVPEKTKRNAAGNPDNLLASRIGSEAAYEVGWSRKGYWMNMNSRVLSRPQIRLPQPAAGVSACSISSIAKARSAVVGRRERMDKKMVSTAPLGVFCLTTLS